jgi:hypothetical protein
MTIVRFSGLDKSFMFVRRGAAVATGKAFAPGAA